jgi:plastocyanin
MTMPTSGSGASLPNASVVTIVGQQGMLSFSPNPVRMTQGDTVVWRNADAAPHHIVMNDGSFDSGNIAPGASSAPMRLGGTGGAYHCIIHPNMMFGSIN